MGRHTTYTEEELITAIAESASFAAVLRKLGLKPGGAQAGVVRKVKELGIDYSHFTGQGHSKGKSPYNKLSAGQILRVLPEGSNRIHAHQLRRALIESGVAAECNRCGLTDWNGKPLQLEVNHIDGDAMNCLFENLEFICPNCHSQETDTNRSHKKKNRS